MYMAAFQDSVPSTLTPEYRELDRQINATQFKIDGTSFGMQTRRSKAKVACRFSAIIYVIIYLLIKYNKYSMLVRDKKGNINVKDNAENVLRIFNDVCKSPELNTFLMKNKIGSGNFVHKNPTKNDLIQKSLFFMGFLNVSEEAKSIDANGIIGHYFIIVNREGTYYIISSYGSDFDIPQTEIELDLKEWDEFVVNFNSMKPEMKPFLKKYFLNNENAYLNNSFSLEDVNIDDFPDRIIPTDPKILRNALIDIEIAKFSKVPHEIISLDNIETLVMPYIGVDGGKPKKKSKKKKSRKYKSRLSMKRTYNNIEKELS